ncbi:MAG: LacI family DNA-binding transcriptional regulator [Solirubrobacteraceae bacterium]
MAARRPAAPTAADVAALAGVSVGTVSKAMNGRGQLRAATRQRVLAAAGELGFQPNALARGLVEGRSYTVGVLTTDSFGRFTLPIMLGVEDALGAGEMTTLLCDGRDDPLREQHYVRTLLSRRVDGIVVTGRRRDPRPPIGDLPIPVVYVYAVSEDARDLSIMCDDEQGAELAVRHLLRTGRTHVAHVTGPQRHLSAVLREAGMRAALAADGKDFAAGGALWGEWSEAWGRDAGQILLRSAEPFDAVFCGSDQIARGVADTLRESGCRVPEDVALVGFDNWDVMATACRPPLTTIDPNLAELGRVAAGKLLHAIEGGTLEQGRLLLPCDLVIRQSTGAPAPAA